MAKGKGGSPEAIQIQRESLAQSKVQHKDMLAAMQAQIDQAKAMKLPKPAPPMPLPDTSQSDMIAQSQEQRRNLQRRNGLMATRVVQPASSPLRSGMGVPMYAS